MSASGPARARRLRAPALLAASTGAATLALHLHDPHAGGSWGYCPSALMGFYCPLCGGLRAVNDLTDLRFGAAASSNLLLVAVLFPLALAWFARWALGSWRGDYRPVSARTQRRLMTWLLPLALIFTVLRNLPLPMGHWLAP